MALDQAAKELDAELKTLDEATDRLRANFEQYFQGVERQPPTTQRDALKRRVLAVRTNPVRNTELRFRVNQLIARFNTYDNYWNRVLKQIEEGTYHRDIVMARYRAKLRETLEQRAAEQSDADQPGKAAAKPAGKRPAPGLSDANVDAIYNAYMMAKRRCKEATKGLTKDALANSLRKQVPSIQKQYKCKSVEFKVVIKGGKAILKAVPKF